MQNIYLMPFSAKSVLLYHVLVGKKVSVKGFFDNDDNVKEQKYCDCPISSPLNMAETHHDTAIILCEPRHYDANKEQLDLLGHVKICYIEDWMTLEEAELSISCVDSESLLSIAPRQANALKILPLTIRKLVLPAGISDNRSLVIDILQLIVTEKCTLKCRHCANLMQYFTNPQHMNLEQIYRDIDLLFSKADWVRSFFIFGGEAFLYKEFQKVMSYLTRFKKQIGGLCVTTNGTIVPSDDTLHAMRECGMSVGISDYGKHSLRIDDLVNKLEVYQIPHSRLNFKWYNYQQLLSPNDNRDAQIVFSTCKERCVSLRNGLLYRCPFLVHAETLQAIPYNTENHIDISLNSVTKADIIKYLAAPEKHTTTPPPGCAYCSGYDIGNMREVPVAEQVEKPLPYIKYEHKGVQ